MAFADFVRAALACYFTFIAVFYTAKLLALRARTGRSHADPGRPGTVQYRGHRLFALFRAGIWAVCVARVPAPGIDPWLGPLPALSAVPVAALGLALLLASLGLVVYVHSYMGDAWRSGVAEEGPRHLIVGGPFALSRHPLFLAIGLGQLGFFLAAPSLFSLACLALGAAVLVRQAGFEEQRMEIAFGEAWRAYVRAVPRLVPRLHRRSP